MRSPGFPPRRASGALRILVPACLIIIFWYHWSQEEDYVMDYRSSTPPPPHRQQGYDQIVVPGSQTGDEADHETSHAQPDVYNEPEAPPHPIDDLVRQADDDFEAMLSKKTNFIEDAAAAYRKRRGRHPPPGFDAWFKFAQDNEAVIVEDFWDQIYHDLTPFWAQPPRLIRKEAARYEMTINVRGGNATAGSDWFWTQIWLKMIKTIEHLLPDMDLALNAMDEPRLVVPWEDVSRYVAEAQHSLALTPPEHVVSDFSTLPGPKEEVDEATVLPEKNWEKTKPYWSIARRGCPPDSPARTADEMKDFDHAPQISPKLAEPHMYEGYVSNYTLSTEFCHQPDLQGLEGIFIQPLSVSATKVLFPMFGGSKLAVNNEILLPAPMYWNEEERFLGSGGHGCPWEDKTNQVIWRGVATGGMNTETNWRGFQRHRFVAMNNGTKLGRVERRKEKPANFALPDKSYRLVPQRKKMLGPWVGEWANVSFTDLMCAADPVNGTCNYTSPHFSVAKGVKLNRQFDSKYLPDIDGNSFSGRYLAFLRSSSLPIKATLWREWHDSRLVAWRHFVPMDNRFGDWFGIMQYLVGFGRDVPGHDRVARKIADQGKEWAERALRKEDMQVYVLRLLLEYARVSDDRRDTMGWVDDIYTPPSTAA